MKRQPPSAVTSARPGRVFRTVVCCVVAIYGGFFGLLTAVLYALAGVVDGGVLLVIGVPTGAAAGVAAALAWCGLMDRGAPAPARRIGRFLGIGTGVGAAVGLAAAAAVHGALVIATGMAKAEILLTGAGFGLGAGAVLGLILGAIWYVAQRRRETPPTPNPQQPDTTE